MLKKKWILFSTLAVGALLAVVALLPTMLLRTSFGDRLVNALLAREGVEFNVRDIHIGWLTPFRMNGASIGPIGKPRLLEIDEVRSDRTLLSALLHGVDVGRLEVTRPRIYIHLDGDTSNLQFPASSVSVPDATKPSRTENARSLTIRVSDAELWLKTETMAEETLVCSGVALTGTMSQGPDTTWLQLDPGTYLERTPVTPQLCHGLLKYVVPVLAEATWTKGELSLTVERCTIDLEQPHESQVVGSLHIHGVEAGINEAWIAAAAAGITQRLGTNGFGTLHLADDAKVSFEVMDGMVQHRGLEFGLPRVSSDLVVRTSGAVGFDERLDVGIHIPMPLHLLSSGPVADALRNQTIELRATGTLAAPQVDLANDDFLADLLTTIGGRLAEEERPLRSVVDGIREALGGGAEQRPLMDRMRRRLDQRRNRQRNSRLTP